MISAEFLDYNSRKLLLKIKGKLWQKKVRNGYG